MNKRKKKWLIGLSLTALLGIVGVFVAARMLAKRFEPYIRDQAILYLRNRFDSEVELQALRVRMPNVSTIRLFLTRGHGAVAQVEGDGLVMHHKGRRDVPPMFAMKHFAFDVDLGNLFTKSKTVPRVVIDGMEVNIPPKGERPKLEAGSSTANGTEETQGDSPNVLIEEVLLTNSMISILPKDRKKTPLQFDLHRVRLQSAGTNVAMKYEAELTNAKPPGEIVSQGTFGPWVKGEPGDTPLDGAYKFEKADLGVFKGIAGILNSTGQFKGTLDSIGVRGEASVPDFRLKKPGNPVPLYTRFEVLVDGTNGNTILQPVHGVLGKTSFTTSGGVIKNPSDAHRTISLDVSMPNGNLPDLLRLAMKGKPFMEGIVMLETKIVIPPLSGKVKEKLQLDGRFELSQGKFLRSTIQDQIDTLSRRAQGQPKNQEIDEVVHQMNGVFQLENEVMTFKSLSFAVPGAGVDLSGSYDLDADMLDFHGALKLQAKVSQTMSGWKRIVLKPIDPFFSKQGAGTFLRIKVEGPADKPKFGRDSGK